MENIEEYFLQLLKNNHSIDIAETEFKRAIAEDDELRSAYREWCEEIGTTERHGFRDFCEEYKDNMDSVWEALTDYDE